MKKNKIKKVLTGAGSIAIAAGIAGGIVSTNANVSNEIIIVQLGESINVDLRDDWTDTWHVTGDVFQEAALRVDDTTVEAHYTATNIDRPSNENDYWHQQQLGTLNFSARKYSEGELRFAKVGFGLNNYAYNNGVPDYETPERATFGHNAILDVPIEYIEGYEITSLGYYIDFNIASENVASLWNHYVMSATLTAFHLIYTAI